VSSGVTGRPGAGALEVRALRRGGHEVQAAGPIEDQLATRLEGPELAAAQLVQECLATAPVGQGIDNAWCGPGDPRSGHS
jgi:hypothetical protein